MVVVDVVVVVVGLGWVVLVTDGVEVSGGVVVTGTVVLDDAAVDTGIGSVAVVATDVLAAGTVESVPRGAVEPGCSVVGVMATTVVVASAEGRSVTCSRTPATAAHAMAIDSRVAPSQPTTSNTVRFTAPSSLWATARAITQR